MKPISIGRLTAMTVINFLIMFLLMYSMVHVFKDVYININKAYMAGLMTAPMVLLEAIFMGSMYENKKAIMSFALLSVFVLILLFSFVRNQTFVDDKEFLRSMIPHHSGAILMCNQAKITDFEIKNLCKSIVASQQSEIDQMRTILKRVDNQ